MEQRLARLPTLDALVTRCNNNLRVYYRVHW
jgi:hypothetical protein